MQLFLVVFALACMNKFVQVSSQTTDAPSEFPTVAPSEFPTEAPSMSVEDLTQPPTTFPTVYPTEFPTEYPSLAPSAVPTEFPSALPTYKPTIAPTYVDVTLSFNVTLTLGGLNSNVLGANDQLAIRQSLAISSGMGVDYVDAVTVFSYSEVERRRILRQAVLRALADSYTLDVINGITVHTSDFPAYGNDPSGLYNSLANSISTSMSDGSFLTTLQAQSAAVGASVTASASSAAAVVTAPVYTYPIGSPTPEPTYAPSPVPSYMPTPHPTKRGPGLDDGKTAGVVIGSIIGAAIVFVGVYYYLKDIRQKKSPIKSAEELELMKGGSPAGGAYITDTNGVLSVVESTENRV